VHDAADHAVSAEDDTCDVCGCWCEAADMEPYDGEDYCLDCLYQHQREYYLEVTGDDPEDLV